MPRSAAVHKPYRLATIAALSAVLIVALPGRPASAAPAKQPVALALVMAQIDRLDAQHAQAVQREQNARDQLTAMRAAIAGDKVQLAADRATLVTARDRLAAALIASYKRGHMSAAAYLLDANSFSDLITRVEVVRRVASGTGDLFTQVRSAAQRLVDTQGARRAAEIRAAAQLKRATAARRQIDAALASKRAVMAGLTSAMRASVGAEQSRRRHLAESTGSVTGGGANIGATFYGDATWYGAAVAGNHTADGEIFDPNALTCASPWLPFNTLLKVTLLSNGRSVVVRVNDRGPLGGGVLDITSRAARIIGLYTIGRGRVRVQVLTGNSSNTAHVAK